MKMTSSAAAALAALLMTSCAHVPDAPADIPQASVSVTREESTDGTAAEAAPQAEETSAVTKDILVQTYEETAPADTAAEDAEEETTAERRSADIPANDERSPYRDTDIDLTVMSGTMVYAQVSDMVYNCDQYVGKVVKAKGPLSYYKDEETGKEYLAVLISDATACCAQGIEFVCGDRSYPEDYPEIGTEIAVTGVFNYYTEGYYTYVELQDAYMEVLY